ncbi:hypothetical protein ISF6_1022 [Piscinibacter sakaiensis]|uniref:Uncharacterized protein n=1 Tax=Piscinibacter sakaiensis TaxID=1547922 RepID=A0A0K8NTQ6_PISS1|nr:hypothetical protein ISF6_1022 [Piscinibacter sakaiensis]
MGRQTVSQEQRTRSKGLRAARSGGNPGSTNRPALPWEGFRSDRGAT